MYEGAVEANDVDLYKPPEGKAQITARIPGSVREGLDDVIRLWRTMAKARGDKHIDKIDLTYVISRLLEVGVETAFAAFGTRPETEDDWAVLEKAINHAVKQTEKR